MKSALTLLCLLSVTVLAVAQTPPGGASASPGSAGNAPVTPALDRLQSAASQANLDIGHMRIEKWKADSGSKQQAQANADSIQRNLSTALPGLISNVRATPQDLTAQFKLYRNLNALYDVFASLTEATGAFGAKSDYEALAQQLNVIDSVRHDLGNALEGLTASTQTELNQLRAQVRMQQQAAAAAAAPPKKVVVDDTEPAKKTTHKKKPQKAGTSTPAAANPGSNDSAPAPKDQ